MELLFRKNNSEALSNFLYRSQIYKQSRKIFEENNFSMQKYLENDRHYIAFGFFGKNKNA